MDKLLEDFIKEWRKENNTEDAVYSSYHYDAMIAFAELYHKSKVNVDLADVGGSLTPKEAFEFVNAVAYNWEYKGEGKWQKKEWDDEPLVNVEQYTTEALYEIYMKQLGQ